MIVGFTITQSTITCPNCGVAKIESMPTDACQHFYECTCGARLKSRPGDCCVFCSYGDAPCSSIQEAKAKDAPTSCCTGKQFGQRRDVAFWHSTAVPSGCR